MLRTLCSITLVFVASTALADTLLVVNKGDASLAFVDIATMKVTHRITTDAEPHEVAVSQDGRIAVVCNYGPDEKPGTTLTVVDLRRKRAVRRFELPGLIRPHGITAAGSRFYFTAEGSYAVARYDAVTTRVDWIAGTGQEVTHMLVVSPGEKKLYAVNIVSSSVSVFDLSRAPKRISLKQIPAGRGVEGIDLAPDGSALWVTSVARRGEVANLTVIDPKTGAVIRTIATTTKLANRLKFTPDGRRVVVSDPGTSEVTVFDATTGDVVTRVTTAAGAAGLVFSPDGKRLYVGCADAGKVQVIDTATWAISGEAATGKEPDGLAYAAE